MRNCKVEVPLSVIRGEDDFDLLVTCSVSPAVASRTSGQPERWSPGEGGDAEVLSAVHDGGPQNGQPWRGELTEVEERAAGDKAVELALEEAADEADCRADAEYDRMRDEQAEDRARARWGHD